MKLTEQEKVTLDKLKKRFRVLKNIAQMNDIEAMVALADDVFNKTGITPVNALKLISLAISIK